MSSNEAPRPLNVPAAVLAWIWPGAGHISLGERRRGLLIMAGVLLLYVSGLLIGGIDVVDRKRDRLWFLAQSLCGPIVFAADYANQNMLDRIPEDWEDDDEWLQGFQEGSPEIRRQLRSTSLGRVNEIGTLYIALAGLMNLVVILDALQGAPRAERVTGGGRRATDVPNGNEAGDEPAVATETESESKDETRA